MNRTRSLTYAILLVKQMDEDPALQAAIQLSLQPVESDEDKANRLSKESFEPVEDRPKVQQMHGLVKLKWPTKTAVNVDAQGDCFLAAILVAQNNVADVFSSVREYRKQLGEFYRNHEAEYLKRAERDGDDASTMTAQQRADNIQRQYVYFDSVDIFMFEMMTNTFVRLYSMRPVASSLTASTLLDMAK
jgi:hypothetical protein